MEWYYIAIIIYWTLSITTLLGYKTTHKEHVKKHYLWYWIIGLYIVIAFPIITPIVLVKEWDNK